MYYYTNAYVQKVWIRNVLCWYNSNSTGSIPIQQEAYGEEIIWDWSRALCLGCLDVFWLVDIFAALGVPSGERIQSEFDPGTSLWAVVLYFDWLIYLQHYRCHLVRGFRVNLIQGPLCGMSCCILKTKRMGMCTCDVHVSCKNLVWN